MRKKTMTIISNLLNFKLKLTYKTKISVPKKMKSGINKKNLLKKIKKSVAWRKLSQLKSQILKIQMAKTRNLQMILLKPIRIKKIRMMKSNSLTTTSTRKIRKLMVLPMIIKNLLLVMIDFLNRFRTLMTKLLNLKLKLRNCKRIQQRKKQSSLSWINKTKNSKRTLK